MESDIAKAANASVRIDRGNARGRATRELVIRTAERLFSERGIHAVSLREIGLAAGLRRNAAIEYHFGTRENLLAAIYVYRSSRLNARRLKLFEDLSAHGELDDLTALLRALFVPHLEHLRDPNDHYVEFLDRAFAEESQLKIVPFEVVAPHMNAVVMIQTEARRCLCDLSDECFERRFMTIFNWAIQKLAEFSRESANETAAEIDLRFDELMAMLVGALRA